MAIGRRSNLLMTTKDPTCLRGELSTAGDVCCDGDECNGVCGGTNCNALPGGTDKCCTSTIRTAAKSCDTNLPPCVVSTLTASMMMLNLTLDVAPVCTDLTLSTGEEWKDSDGETCASLYNSLSSFCHIFGARCVCECVCLCVRE